MCVCLCIICNIYLFRVDEKLAIRVADFGLARDIYTTEYYRIQKHVMLPVKWMSLESLLDGYFDEKTDVVCMHIFLVHALLVKCVCILL